MTEKKVWKGKLGRMTLKSTRDSMTLTFPRPAEITRIAVVGNAVKNLDEVTVTNSKGKKLHFKLHARDGMSQASVKAGKVKKMTISGKVDRKRGR